LRDAVLDREYLEIVERTRHFLRDAQLDSKGGSASAISEEMRESRRRPLADRRQSYLVGRIDDQAGWYDGRAKRARQRYLLWTTLTIALEFAGVVGGIVIVLSDVQVDALGIFAAGAAAVLAWTETNQYANLAKSYSNAAADLAALRSRAVHATTEEAWADFVAMAEEAISREHVSWAAAGGTTASELRGVFGSTQE
jgi:hypothetical protein